MNTIPATVLSVDHFEGISSIVFEARDTVLTMLGLEPPAGLDRGAKVELGIKSTHITIACEAPRQIAVSNIIPVTLVDMEIGRIVSILKLDFKGLELEAILPVNSLMKLSLEKEDNLFAIFQASELFVHRTIS